jgi:hypothetical protein
VVNGWQEFGLVVFANRLSRFAGSTARSLTLLLSHRLPPFLPSQVWIKVFDSQLYIKVQTCIVLFFFFARVIARIAEAGIELQRLDDVRPSASDNLPVRILTVHFIAILLVCYRGYL